MAVVAQKTLLITEEGLKNLKEELEFLKNDRRKQVAERLKEAISYGDLSENSEYQEAKEEQAFLEGKINDLEKQVQNAQVVKESEIKKNIVHIGSAVVLALDGKNIGEFIVVGATEADPFNNKVSNESPVGAALLGKKKGSAVEIETPSGVKSYEILELK